jgi:hypothetical protein
LVVEGEVELWSKELIGDQSDANSDDVEFICADSESDFESLDSRLESAFASGLASVLEVEFAPDPVVALSPSGCCPLADAAEDDSDGAGVCSGLVSVPILILT